MPHLLYSGRTYWGQKRLGDEVLPEDVGSMGRGTPGGGRDSGRLDNPAAFLWDPGLEGWEP